MSVCSQCVKTTADSKDNYDKTIFLNLLDSYIEYDIFDTDKSIVASNNYEEPITKCDELSSHLKFMKLK